MPGALTSPPLPAAVTTTIPSAQSRSTASVSGAVAGVVGEALPAGQVGPGHDPSVQVGHVGDAGVDHRHGHPGAGRALPGPLGVGACGGALAGDVALAAGDLVVVVAAEHGQTAVG